MLKTMSKISVLTLIAALFVFAFAGVAFAEEGDEEQLVQPVEMEELDLPVGGWAPAEAVYVSDDLVVNGSGSSDKKRKGSSKNGSSLDPIFTDGGAASTGYDALDPGQQELYEAIDNAAKDFMNAGDLEPTDVDEGREVVERYIIGEIKYNQTENGDQTEEEIEQKKQDALKAYYAYDYDHPAYYWLSNLILFNNQYLYPCTEKEYASVSARQDINKKVIDGVEAYKAVAEKGTDTLDKVALVHDQIVNDIDYAYQEDGKTPVEEKWAHGVHGVFDPDIKLAVCEGYADAFALIMNCMGITNYYIVGDAGSGGPGGGDGHAWNAVKDDATGTYLYMDLTWDDRGEDGYSYAYYGMPKADFEKSHYKYTANATQAKEWLYDIDKVGEDYNDYNDSFAGTYYNRGSFYYDGSTDVSDLVIAAKKKAVRAGGWVSVLCPDEDSVVDAADALCVEASYYPVTYNGDDYKYLTAEVSTPVYKWSEDYSQATATRIYKNADGDAESEETEPVNTSVTGEKEPTCTEDGTITYTATFEVGGIPKKKKEVVTQEAFGHDWSEPKYTWAQDFKTVTAERVCSHPTEDACTETETVNTKSKVTRAATYTAKGQTTYTAAFANPAFKASKVVTNIPMLAKKANPMKVKATAKTVKVKTLKKKALVVTPLRVTYAKGTVRYKVVGGNAKSKKALALNTKTGKVTVKKKTKKGKYQIKVKVTAAGTTAYKALSKTVTVTVNAK